MSKEWLYYAHWPPLRLRFRFLQTQVYLMSSQRYINYWHFSLITNNDNNDKSTHFKRGTLRLSKSNLFVPPSRQFHSFIKLNHPQTGWSADLFDAHWSDLWKTSKRIDLPFGYGRDASTVGAQYRRKWIHDCHSSWLILVTKFTARHTLSCVCYVFIIS